jgi:hypothetical protein
MENLCKTIEWLLNSSIPDITNKELLTKKIGECGLFCDNRLSPNDNTKSIYGDDVIYKINVNSNRRSDIENAGGLWQTPMQLAEYLLFFKDKEIETFLEIGTCTGYTSVIICTYLLRFNLKRYDTYDILPICKLNDIFIKYKLPINYKVGSPDFIINDVNKYYDVVFIDGDHSYNGIKSDFNNFGKNCKFVSFHDINDYFCQGVVEFWKELKTTYQNNIFHEFTMHPNNFKLMGFGIMVNK